MDISFPLKRADGTQVQVLISGAIEKSELTHLFWMLAVAALDFKPSAETPTDVIRAVLAELEGESKR